ncbi:NlpC/P60 family protein [Vallicoccus soli]|uniref:NlpC/P60 family protein n=1 Tax=Vallicoccus soli TaxID=2339232 RepID=A0A3A3Z2H8_9ACTN|nr:NlpC/P60 family protein [Vallicoccus soli]
MALCSAALSGAVLVPGTAQADPRPTLAQVQRQVDALEREAEVAAERVNAAADAADAAQARLAVVRAQVARTEARLARARTAAGELAAANYRAGGVSPVLHVLFAEDAGQFLDRAASAGRIAERQSEVVEQVATAQAAVDERRAAVAAEVRRLAEIESRRVADQRSVQDRAERAQALLATLQEEERRRIARAEARAAARAAEAARAARDELRAVPADASDASDSSDSPDEGAAPASSGSQQDAPSSGSSSASGAAAVAVETALAQVGDSYVYGATGPSSFDCSGLTGYAWAAAGVDLPRSSSAQYAAGTKVSKSDLQPGDLVYYYSPISHVGMYIGDGMIVHAANPRSGVGTAPLDSMPYVGATRP